MALILAAPLALSSPQIDIRDAWSGDSKEFAQAIAPGAGFSFLYNGSLVGPDFGSDWQRVLEMDPKDNSVRVTLTHTSGLAVTRDTRILAGFDAVEYKLRFKNTTRRVLPSISMVNALNISFGAPVLEGNCVVSSGGGYADRTLPPRTFAIRRTCFAATAADNGVVELTTEGGKSSNKDLPFFFVHNDAKNEGVFVAFGWSGQWQAFTALHLPPGTLNIRGKIPDLQIALEPNEELEGPTVLVGLYAGALEAGSNQLRRLLRDVYTPRLAGAKMMPVTTYDFYVGLDAKFTEPLLKKHIDAAAAIDQEYFLLDAGWYEGDDWFSSVGNWDLVSKSRLPNGLKPVADYVRSKGLKFGLWFEPERVAGNSKLAREHPEWILWEYRKEHDTPASLNSWSWLTDFHPNLMKKAIETGFGILDYGRPEVQQWVRNMLDRYIREHGVKYIRYDFNVDPLPYWDAHDKPNRRGMSQLLHIKGFYAVIDWIRARHPDVVLEGCAGGGRRIDLETARRFHTFWISDNTVDPAIIRYHLFGINYFLPGNYSYINYTLPAPLQKDFKPDDLGFQSLFGGAFGTGGRVDLWPEEMKQQARRHIAVHKKIRRYLVEDYYPLSRQPADLESWSGWQFHDPQDQSGFVQTFRTKTPDSKHRFFIQKLEESARYRFTDAYSAEGFEVGGSTAMTNGIEVTQAAMSSRVLTYRKITNISAE